MDWINLSIKYVLLSAHKDIWRSFVIHVMLLQPYFALIILFKPHDIFDRIYEIKKYQGIHLRLLQDFLESYNSIWFP